MARPALSKGLTLFLRIMFALVVACLVMAGVLKLLERTGDPLRQGIERAVADMTQSHVYLESLPNPKFFPDIHLTLKNIAVSDSADATKRLGSVDSVEFSVPFIGTLIGSPSFKIFTINDLRIEKDIFFPRMMMIDLATIEPSVPTPVFMTMGTLGDTPFSLRLDVEEKGGRYRLGREARAVFTLGGVVVSGMLTATRDGLLLKAAEMKGDGGQAFGPADFFILQNQSFVKDNPVRCLLDQPADLKLTPAHPCATLFNQVTKEDTE